MPATRPSVSTVAGRTPGCGPVLAVLTDGATVAVVTALPLHDPSGVLRPAPHRVPDAADRYAVR